MRLAHSLGSITRPGSLGIISAFLVKSTPLRCDKCKVRQLIFIKNQLKKERLPKQPLIIANKWSQGKKDHGTDWQKWIIRG